MPHLLLYYSLVCGLFHLVRSDCYLYQSLCEAPHAIPDNSPTYNTIAIAKKLCEGKNSQLCQKLAALQNPLQTACDSVTQNSSAPGHIASTYIKVIVDAEFSTPQLFFRINDIPKCGSTPPPEYATTAGPPSPPASWTFSQVFNLPDKPTNVEVFATKFAALYEDQVYLWENDGSGSVDTIHIPEEKVMGFGKITSPERLLLCVKNKDLQILASNGAVSTVKTLSFVPYSACEITAAGQLRYVVSSEEDDKLYVLDTSYNVVSSYNIEFKAKYITCCPNGDVVYGNDGNEVARRVVATGTSVWYKTSFSGGQGVHCDALNYIWYANKNLPGVYQLNGATGNIDQSHTLTGEPFDVKVVYDGSGVPAMIVANNKDQVLRKYV